MPVRVAGAGSGDRFRKVAEGSGVCWCRFQRQVPEGSGESRQVPVFAGVGSGGKFRKVPEGSGRFRKGLEGCGKFRRVPARAGVGGRFRRVLEVPKPGSGVPVRAGVGSGGRVRKVPESSGVYIYIYIYIYDTAVGDATAAFLLPKHYFTKT